MTENANRGEGLSGLAHSDSAADVVERYNSWVANYEDDVLSWGYGVPSMIAELFAAETRNRSLPVLDAGCGTGLVGQAIVDLLGESAPPLLGVDMSLGSLRQAQDRVWAGGAVYASLSEVDLSARLPFDDSSLCSIVCGGVMTYLPDTSSVLREFLRVTDPDGAVIFSQRTDLWDERRCAQVIEDLVAGGFCRADVGDPQPYLPGLNEYGDSIKVIYTVLHQTLND